MDAQLRAGTASNAIGSGGMSAAEAPLTLDIMQRTALALDTANEVANRLFALRDRLFGSPPETANASAQPPSANSFASAYSEKARYLADALNVIDRLSLDLANRL